MQKVANFELFGSFPIQTNRIFLTEENKKDSILANPTAVVAIIFHRFLMIYFSSFTYGFGFNFFHIISIIVFITEKIYFKDLFKKIKLRLKIENL